ncbi:MAG: TonB-dependent receptor [Deltaproteobacteria bacterium]|nr:TonB-dependent receptor [Deltaproteobacteria bacterium]
MLRSVLVLVLATSIAHAQPDPSSGDPAPEEPVAPPAPQPEPACKGTVDGHAVDASTHAPVAGAMVRTGDELLGVTDDAGRFVLTGRCAGELELVVERDDYKPATRRVTVRDRASVEVELVSRGEVIEIRDRAPPPTEMRSATTVSGAALERSRGKGFTAAIADVPGVAELRSATGVAKPIIRGQFGRRLLLLVDDVRHRAQEWGLEHAPEIDPFIAGAIRVVRGAGGVRYGSDAIGGVVLVDPPDLRREPGTGGEAHLIGAANGRGGTFAGRLQSVLPQLPGISTQLEGSVKRLAAPSAPGYALDNAGVFEWSAGAVVGYRSRRGEYKLSYRHYDADLGVCACLRVHNIADFLAQAQAERPIGADEFRSEFEIDRPRQAVEHDLALARGRWELEKTGSLTATLSFQHDRRREFDVVRMGDTAGAQFNFRLYTVEADAVFEHVPIHLSEHWHLRGAAGVVGNLQVHRYKGLNLIPSYRGAAGGVYATERLVGHDTDFEVGARYDFLDRTASLERIDFLRLVRSEQIALDACSDPAADQVACGSRYHTFTASAGAMRRFAATWSVKGELSLASRAPNPDEQYLNGTAPTFPVLGLGKPDIRPETTYGTSVTLAHAGKRVAAEASAFANYIDDYIYFAPAIGPDGKPIFDTLVRGAFPRFITRGVDAMFYGADGGINVAVVPGAEAPVLELGAQASLVRARNRTDDGYLVFIPADRVRGQVTYRAGKTSATVSGAYVARQRRFDAIADFVPPPPAYFLLGAEVTTETKMAGQTVRFALEGRNLTNARYRDYTSLMRYFADEPGWQAWLRMSVFFDTKKGT